MSPEDLGQIDTFREEENRVLTGAVEALRKGEWAKAKAWCEARQGEQVVLAPARPAAALGLEPRRRGGRASARRSPGTRRPFAGVQSLDEAAERYAAGAFEVDRAHRRFEQRRLALLESRLPHYGALREVATELRRAHRAWADQLARDFAGLCKEHGFLPSSELQQRNLFEQVVHPLTLTGEKVAVFVIDAFRYEMATELVEELEGQRHDRRSEAAPRRAADNHVVGMNVLAPVAQGDRLTVAGIFQGFRTGEFTVSDAGAPARRHGAAERRASRRSSSSSRRSARQARRPSRRR